MTAEKETSMLPCARCAAPAKLQCPNCLKLGLPKEASVFCSQECFKAAWPEHKKVHSPPADAWLFCTKRGKARADAMPDFEWTGPLRPYRISPMREIPAHIPKPDYHKDGYPYKEQESRQQQIVPIRGPDDTAGIRAACRIGREVLDLAAAAAKPGVTTDELDRIVHEAMIERGAYPSPYNYFNFPKSVCTSINEVICHGIPDARELQNGDILNIDVTAYFKGFHGDLNETICVGEVDEEGKKLIKVTHDALMKAIAACKPGVRYRDIGDIITKHASANGFQVVKSYCGHGIGDLFHCAPNVPHYAHNKAVGVMKEGHVFTIEPMINEGSWRDRTWPDGWTAVTEDGKRSAQFEHTLIVTKDGCEVLTKRLETSPPLWWETPAA
ncbi:hypothetical protein CHLRE_06g279750v5 [Chlamydomonas reinhardtii]|uniref:Methionine aminopeptidase n=1 Tax=Chlamydomonas reinhardtii TaxID=3055 RepID=A8J1Z0_CHLRE|nr:uncharacterized protein CHLRE_06g279750v5 [Chlamydomonas reinhardtii]PNW82456.1 hypothetical protein CHLRE_06g279750v5 [Chlamydomonas reinhardtii]|eukprot:XP_001695426.1 methionine aminopeptidase [Chlamydomonas reinhardtii]